MKKLITLLLPVLVLVMTANPASASFFLCEKTDPQTGNIIPPDSPQYDKIDYDSQIVYLLQTISNIALVGVFLFGILGAIYATIRDATYTGDGELEAAHYVKMRSRLMIGGVLIPVLIIVGSFILEFVTYYEMTCFLSLPI